MSYAKLVIDELAEATTRVPLAKPRLKSSLIFAIKHIYACIDLGKTFFFVNVFFFYLKKYFNVT